MIALNPVNRLILSAIADMLLIPLQHGVGELFLILDLRSHNTIFNVILTLQKFKILKFNVI